MTECQHRWEPSNFGTKYHIPKEYLFYQCTRCGQLISTLLKEKQNGH